MEPEELEFFAEKQEISIIPTFNSPTIHMITGDVGPFRAGLPTNVPMWMAISLKQQKKCKVQAPDWMDMELLENVKENEKTARIFTKMPSDHYMIEAKLLLGHAADDIPQAEELRTIIKDIWDIRMSKLRASIDALIKGTGSYAAVDHLTPIEINSIRPILPHALDQLYRMRNSMKHGGTQSQNTTTFGNSSNSLNSSSRITNSSFRSSHT